MPLSKSAIRFGRGVDPDAIRRGGEAGLPRLAGVLDVRSVEYVSAQAPGD